MGAFIGLYIAQIVLSLIILAAVPKREDLPKINNARGTAIKLGFVPCVGFMLVYQLGFLGYYFAARTREENKRSQLAGRLMTTSFDSPAAARSSSPVAPGANPFADTAGGGASAAGPAPDNPFM